MQQSDSRKFYLKLAPFVFLVAVFALYMRSEFQQTTDSSRSQNRAESQTQSGSQGTKAQASFPFQDSERISEIKKTLMRIRSGEKRFKQDGVVFRNVEGMLPKKPNGYYHEYTVITPSARNRGARRVVTGEGGELYYTDDHYKTFFPFDEEHLN